MDELHFIIVNSKLPHAQLLRPELERRVSFEVFQETDGEEVWSVMEGGKDDMYVYDRCGRLAYYIPFPLSIMLEGQNVVMSAIFATYFRSPCGVTCGGNKSSEFEDFLDHLNDTDENTIANTEGTVDITSIETSPDIQGTNISEISNISNSNDTLSATEQAANSANAYGNNYSPIFNDSDYQVYNDTLDYGMANDTHIDQVHDIFNNLYNLFFRSPSNETRKSSSHVPSTNVTLTDSLEIQSHLSPKDHSENHTEHSHHTPKPNVDKANRNKISDRCAEADFTVCRDWSKTKLIQAQKCCMSTRRDLKDDRESCRYFGKKRCKKIRSILKCCLKTVLIETTTADVATTTESTTTEMPDADFKEVVCCKNTKEGKVCRVAKTLECDSECPPVCDEDEYIDDNTNMTK